MRSSLIVLLFLIVASLPTSAFAGGSCDVKTLELSSYVKSNKSRFTEYLTHGTKTRKPLSPAKASQKMDELLKGVDDGEYVMKHTKILGDGDYVGSGSELSFVRKSDGAQFNFHINMDDLPSTSAASKSMDDALSLVDDAAPSVTKTSIPAETQGNISNFESSMRRMSESEGVIKATDTDGAIKKYSYEIAQGKKIPLLDNMAEGTTGASKVEVMFFGDKSARVMVKNDSGEFLKSIVLTDDEFAKFVAGMK